MVEKFLNISSQFSKRTAIINADESDLSFEGLEKCIEDILRIFICNGLENSYLPILAPKNSTVIATFVACLRFNICYIPLDINSPVNRNKKIIQEIGSSYLIISASQMEAYSSTISRVICSIQNNILLVQTCFNEGPKNTNQAYILFTSGSTGVPKGVIISRINMYSFLDWATETFSFYSGRILSIAPFHFDISVFDIYFSLFTGSTLVIPEDSIIKAPREIGKFIENNSINIIYSTPSVLNHFLNYGDLNSFPLYCIKLILSAGEVLKTSLTEQLFSIFPEASIFNLYGPTETNVCTFYQVSKKDKQGNVPIGRVCEQLKLRLLSIDDRSDTPLEGELCIAGGNVFEGYWKANESEVFFKDNGLTFYKTGDWVHQENGLLYFLHRMDRMIKHNGNRIELAEIEMAIMQNEKIQWAVVLPYGISGREQIVAFIQIKSATNLISIQELRLFLTQILPPYMLPSRYLFITEIPLSSNHKPDFQKLLKLLNE